MAADGSYLLADVLDVSDDGHVGSSQRVKMEKILEKRLQPEGENSSVTKVLKHLVIYNNFSEKKGQSEK